jgi:mono/diheme cytochrome c family protein
MTMTSRLQAMLRAASLIAASALFPAASAAPSNSASSSNSGAASGSDSAARPKSAAMSGSMPALHEPLPTFSPWSGSGVSAGHGHFVQRDGAALFGAICQGCHMPDARGAHGAGAYPALAGNVRLASAAYPIATVLRGRNGMPAVGELDDAQVAAVVGYVRTHFGNAYSDMITMEDVARVRATLP